jgi:hypothetical protein
MTSFANTRLNRLPPPGSKFSPGAPRNHQSDTGARK